MSKNRQTTNAFTNANTPKAAKPIIATLATDEQGLIRVWGVSKADNTHFPISINSGGGYKDLETLRNDLPKFEVLGVVVPQHYFR